MTLDHTRIEELLALDALGALDEDDRVRLERERAAHGECEECARLQAGFVETAGRLGFALDPVPVDPSIADTILRIARPRPVELVAADRSDVVVLDEPRRRIPWRSLIAVAAALSLVAGILTLRALTRTGTVTVAFEGQTAARMRMTYKPGGSLIRLRGTGFDSLPQGQVYELWTFDGPTPLKTTCFSTQDGGVALSVEAPVPPEGTMAVTIEPRCETSPTSAPILSVDLSTIS